MAYLSFLSQGHFYTSRKLIKLNSRKLVDLIRDFGILTKKKKIFKNKWSAITISDRKSMSEYYFSHNSHKNLITKKINLT